MRASVYRRQQEQMIIKASWILVSVGSSILILLLAILSVAWNLVRLSS